MTYLKYIFSDKKSGVYWIVILAFTSILTLLRIIVSTKTSNPDLVDFLSTYSYLIIFFVLFLGFYTSGYFNFLLQRKFTNQHKSIIKKNDTCQVDIYYNRLSIKTIIHNYDTNIEIPTGRDFYHICTTTNSIVVLGQVNFLGVFRFHLKPIQIDLYNSTNDRLKFTYKPAIDKIEIYNRDLTINFSKNKYEIRKLVIKDYQ